MIIGLDWIGLHWIGLLDGIIGYHYWMVFVLPNSDVAVYYSSQGRFFFFFYAFLPQNSHN